IPRRRAQTVLILFGLMLATLIITASLSVGDTLNYSLQAIQLKQIGGIDEAFTRHQANQYVQGASTADSEFFSGAQAADVVARAKQDANVDAVVGVIAASGSMIDTSTGQSSSENVAIFGVPTDFGSVWGQLHSSAGANLDVATLAPNEVFVGSLLGGTLNANPGDRLELYVDGHPTPAIKAQIKKIHDQASFLDPTQDLSRRLLVELNQPAVTDEFKALAGDRFVDRIIGDAVAAAAVASGGQSASRTAQDNLFQRVG